MKTMKTLMAAAAMVAMTGTAQAALIDQDNGTVLDATTNLIWLQNWSGQRRAWIPHKTWVENLDFGGSTDWRLPEISEYAALFTAYGNLTNVTNFTIGTGNYWSGTEVTAGGDSAWFFNPGNGNQGTSLKGSSRLTVAVRLRDVTAVPEPQTLALVLMALGAMVAVRRRRTR